MMEGKRNGFALILAIAAMAFMVLLVLTLSSVITSKLRLLNAQKDMRLARSNAVLGMSVAISELQRTLGPDNAISFPSTILDSDPTTPLIDGVKVPYLTGTISVNKNVSSMTFIEAQKEQRNSIDSLKEGVASSDERLNWLVSSEKSISDPMNESLHDLNSEVIKLASYKMLSDYPETFGGYVSSAIKDKEVDVYAGKVKVGNESAYAWWISDESVKAKINLTRPKKYLDGESTGSAESFEAPADRRIPQISYLGFIDELSNFQLNPFLPEFSEAEADTLAKTSSMDELAFIDSSLTQWAKDNKGDYTASSLGIPVDVTQGRFKQDLSVYLHKDGDGRGVNDSDPIIRGHEKDENYTGPKFEISDYEQNIPRMGLLRDWATMLENAGEAFEDGIKARPHVNKKSDTRHGLYPVVSKVGWTYRMVYKGDPNGEITLYLGFYPRITLWNPHGVTITESDYLLRLYMPYYIELATVVEGYEVISGGKGGLPNETTLAPLIVRSATAKEATVKIGGQDKKVRFHPYKIFEIQTGGDSIIKGDFNTSSLILFSHFLKGRALNKGKGNHSEGEGSVLGLPVINMEIPNLMLRPGETLELVASDDSSAMQEYDPSSDSKGAPSSKSYPQLMSGVPRIDGNRIDAGVGILINTGVKLAVKENPIVHSDIPGSGAENSVFADLVKSTPENPVVSGGWRVGSVYPSSRLVSDTDANKSSYPNIGYELWSKDGGDYEYLISYDTTLIDGSKTKWDGWRYAVLKLAANDHASIFSSMMPRYFTIGHAWNKNLDSKSSMTTSYGSYPADMGASNFSGSYKNKVGEKPAARVVDGSVKAPVGYQYKRIGNIDVIRSREWRTTDNLYGVDFLEKADETHTSDYNVVSGNIDDITPNYTWVSWGIPVTGPTKDKKSGGAKYPYMPPYVALGNYIRDNGNAVRVDAMHGYAMMAPNTQNQGWLSNMWSSMFILDNVHWPYAPINKTVDAGVFDKDVNFDYVSHYKNDDGTRYGGFALFAHTRTFNTTVGTWDQHKTRAGLVHPMFHYPRSADDLMSLGVLSNANLSTMLWQPMTAFGESWASPFLKRDEIVNTKYKKMHENELIDITYMLNASLWDRFYLSTIPQDGLGEIFAGMRLSNTRHILIPQSYEKENLYATEDAFKRSAASVKIDGAFNVNSTSYEAWRAFLSGMLGIKKQSLIKEEYPTKIDTSSPENFYMPNPGNLNAALPPEPENIEFTGRDSGTGRNISEADLDELTREIVAEVKRRAPFFSLADFVNRRLMSFDDADTEDKKYQSLMGTMAAAISRIAEEYNLKKPSVFNSDYLFERKNPAGRDEMLTFMSEVSEEFVEQATMTPKGKSFRRLAGLKGAQLMQSQLLAGIAPFMTVRGDTFTIRAFGEHKNPMTGTTSKAYCEALVQRSSEPVEASDDIVTPEGAFGRRFNIVSFRWLTPAEL